MTDYMTPDEEEVLAQKLEASKNFKILRRLKGFELSGFAQGTKTYEGIYVDVEATGLDTDKDEIIELGAWPFMFTGNGQIVDLADQLHWYRQPSRPISAEITKLTGISPEMVEGKTVDMTTLDYWVDKVDLIVAHHAAYDRPMLERLSPAFAKKCWGCSMSEVPWQENGIAGKRLEYILSSMGRFYEAHNAVADCEAGLFALQAELGADKRTGLSYVLDAARSTTWHVWAIKAPFDAKDALKARGYFWNGGEDGRPKAWHREIPDADRAAEEEWLNRNVYRGQMHCPARFDRVTAYERFSKRG